VAEEREVDEYFSNTTKRGQRLNVEAQANNTEKRSLAESSVFVDEICMIVRVRL
jgi:hypothetical protein